MNDPFETARSPFILFYLNREVLNLYEIYNSVFLNLKIKELNLHSELMSMYKKKTKEYKRNVLYM